MITSISQFDHSYSQEIESTQKVLKHVTNDSLTKVIHPNVRTLGRLAWHIVTTIPEMTSKMGLTIAGPKEHDPIPATAKEILQGYSDAAISLLETIKKDWTDATLDVVDDMYGEKWKRGFSLSGFIKHEIHHRAQMIVLMRQLGLAVPGVYGPTREEWKMYGMAAPEV